MCFDSLVMGLQCVRRSVGQVALSLWNPLSSFFFLFFVCWTRKVYVRGVQLGVEKLEQPFSHPSLSPLSHKPHYCYHSGAVLTRPLRKLGLIWEHDLLFANVFHARFNVPGECRPHVSTVLFIVEGNIIQWANHLSRLM